MYNRNHLLQQEELSGLERSNQTGNNNALLTKEAEKYFGDVRPNATPFSGLGNGQILYITEPESGFSEKELQILETKAKGVKLNPNVLRAETAPLVALSIIGVHV